MVVQPSRSQQRDASMGGAKMTVQHELRLVLSCLVFVFWGVELIKSILKRNLTTVEAQ
jgi:hypothetical protein